MREKFQHASLVLVGLCAGVAISLNYSASANKEAATPLPVEELRTFAEVFNAIKHNYVEPVDDKKLITNAISGMLAGLDPHSAYLDPDAYKDLQVIMQGEFVGLGIEVGMEDGLVKVISPIEDTPAFRAGVRPGDLIVKLDDTSVKGMSLNDAVKRMRGKPNTQIRLTIARKGEAKPIDVTLTRETIHVQSVKARMLEPGVGYVRILTFQENSAPDLVKALEKLNKQGLKSLVLDLRNDPGGLLHAAVGVSGTFLPQRALVVSTDGQTEDARHKTLVVPDEYLRGTKDDFLKNVPENFKTLPMVVLVNGASASASEIVAGALQDHKRAVIVGSQTFGKGSVQNIVPLLNNAGAAIKLTTARYFTPSGRSIQAKGIVPDIVVEDTPSGSLLRMREADLDHHLSNPTGDGAEASKPVAPKAKDVPKTEAREPAEKDGVREDVEAIAPFEIGSKKDFQLAQAVNVLKGMQLMQQQAH